MSVLAYAPALSPVPSLRQAPLVQGGRPLAVVEGELASLRRRLAALQGGVGRAAQAWRQTLQLARIHLSLTASRLLPVWRDLSRERRAVDRVAVRVAQLQAMTDASLQDDGATDELAEARRAVLAEELQNHLARSLAFLRALEAVAEPDSLSALAELWSQEGERLQRAQWVGQTLAAERPMPQLPAPSHA